MIRENYIPIVKLKMVKEKGLPYGEKKLDGPEKVVELASLLLDGADREYLLVISVNAKTQPLALEIVSIGSVDTAFAVPRETFKHAVLSNAAGILLVHNHPSGDCRPSKEDMEITERMERAGEILGIPVIDHVVIGEGEFYSFKERERYKEEIQ